MPRASPAKRSKPAALESLTPGERGQVLDALIAERPELSTEAERIAVELLGSVSIDQAASDVEAALTRIPLEALGSRVGRVRGRGYLDETDAAWELVEEAIEPFRSDLRRRAAVGACDAAASLAVGIVAGLYRIRQPVAGTVLAYAGEDAPSELADDVLGLASMLGVEVFEDTSDNHWPDWTGLLRPYRADEEHGAF